MRRILSQLISHPLYKLKAGKSRHAYISNDYVRVVFEYSPQGRFPILHYIHAFH